VLEAIPQLASGKIDRRSLPVSLTAKPNIEAGQLPTTRLERELTTMWADVLDLPEIGIDDDFFACGGDSLRAASLFAEIEHRLGLDRPISLLLSAPSVRQLARVIESEQSWSGLVAIQPHGTRPQLFVVHDHYGNLFPMRAMTELIGPDQPVYGLQADALGGSATLDGTLEQLAERYVAQVRALRPHGPYFLYGHVVGGVIAFEMAVQLQAAGETVELLAVADMPGPLPPPLPWPRRLASKARRLRSASRQEVLRGVEHLARRRTQQLGRQARSLSTQRRSAGRAEAPSPVSTSGDLTPVGRAALAHAHYVALARRYRPAGPLNGSMLLIRGPGADDSDWGWAPHVTGVVRPVKLPALRETLSQDRSGAALLAGESAD
jgi:acyl carrier protein